MTTSTRSRLLGAGCVFLFLVLLWLYPLLSLKLAAQFDFGVHLRWASQFHEALQEGNVLPRWAYASVDGLGDPTFFYYQPLVYYISSFFHMLGCDLRVALLLTEICSFALLGSTVFFYFLRRYPNRGAALGTIFVLACPPLYFLATQMAAFPWVFSMPFSVLFVAETIRERQRPTRLAVLICLICLAHLLSGLMTLFATGLARLIFAFPNRHNLREHLRWGLGVALGLALSAFFLYPAITQLDLITPSGWLGPFDWHRGFVFPLFTYLRYGLLWIGPQIPFPFLAVGLAMLTLFPRMPIPDREAGLTARRLAIVSLVSLAFASELAYPMYANVSALHKLQFPYRFMFLACVLAAIAFVIHLNTGAWSRWSRPVKSAALVMMILYIAQAGILQWKLIRSGERLPEPASLMHGRFGQPEYMPAVHGPHWEAYVADGKLAGECRRLGIRCDVTSQRSHDMNVSIASSRSVAVRLPVFAFPAWRASVDGVTQPYAFDKDTGLLLVQLPPGTHVVALGWSRLPAEVTGLWISAGALCILLGSLAFFRRRTGEVQSALPSLSEKHVMHAQANTARKYSKQ